jgi:thiol-disulfide isomerase/thioredoxin
MYSPNGKQLDTYLRVENSAGTELAEDDDSAGNLNSRIVFRPAVEDTYRIIATTFDPGQTGVYKVVVRQALLHAGKVAVLPAVRIPTDFPPLLLQKVLSTAGKPVFAGAVLFDDKGRPAGGKSVQFRWDKGETKVIANEYGALRLALTQDKLRGLAVEIPQGIKGALELTDQIGNPTALNLAPEFAKETVKSAGGKLVFQTDALLTDKEPLDQVRNKCYCRAHPIRMAAGSIYTIDVASTGFNTYLRLVDPSGKQLAEDDDSGGGEFGHDARITFTAPKTDTYVIIATTYGPGATGKFSLTAAAGSEKDKKQGQLNQLNADFKKVLGDLGQKYSLSKSEDEKEKIFDQYFEAAIDYAIKFNAFAEANASDPTSKEATTMCSQLLAMASGQAKSAGAGAKFRELMTNAKSKDVQGMATVALGGNLLLQYEKAYQTKDKAATAKLADEAESMLKQAKTKYGDLPAPRGTIGSQADDLLDLLQHRSVGKNAAEITGEDIDSKKFKLSDYKGKVVVLYFWGSWCGPCVAMIPDEKKLVARLEKARFAMVGINTDTDRSKAKKFLEDKGITWTQVFDGGTQGPIDKAWRVDHWPTIYILDANGVIRYREIRGEAMDRAVDELLKELHGGGK